MFQESQNQEYLDLVIQRAKQDYLTWVEQFLDIIEANIALKDRRTLNDIGCNVGQFWKGLARRKLNIEYRGYDIEPVYIQSAGEIFPEISDALRILDITREQPESADISVVSATIEHLEFLSPGIDNILKTTNKLIVLRTFLDKVSDKSVFLKKKAKTFYYINQYSFVELLSIFDKYGFKTKVVRDRHTDSMPKYLGQGIVRSQYVVVGLREDAKRE